MINEYEKFEDLEITDSREVWYQTTRQLECEWNDKKFTVRVVESSKSGEIIWMEGEDQFTEEERDQIDEYLWSGEIDINC
tara:strand:+ start:422 stop:661 length:240 start_codon:yes stop_codon:yes gene_type:complete